MEIKRFTEGAIGKGLYSDPTGELCGYHHVERLIAERDTLQQRLNVVEEENDRLRELLRLARDSHGVMWLTDPPQDPWKVRQISEQITEVLEKRP